MSSYSCSMCGVLSKTKGTIKTHIENKCKGAVLLTKLVLIKCEICGKESETEYLMEKHKSNCVKRRVRDIEDNIHGELKKQSSEIVKIFLAVKNQISRYEDENKKLREQVDALQKCLDAYEIL